MTVLVFQNAFRRSTYVVLFAIIIGNMLNVPRVFSEIPEIVQYGLFKEPPVTLIEAAQLATEHMRSMNLPKDCFIRGITFSLTMEEDGKPHYVVYFRPQGGIISIDRSEDPTTAEFEFMKVWMDKKVTIERGVGKVVKPSDKK